MPSVSPGTEEADRRTAGSHPPYCGVAIRRDPHACKVVCIDLVFDELAATLFVHIDATSLAVVDLAADHSGVGVRLDLKASYPVPMDVTALKIALENDKKTNKRMTKIINWYTEVNGTIYIRPLLRMMSYKVHI